MEYTVYVLSSLSTKKSYVGFTDNLERRLHERNSGRGYFTKRYMPWKVIYTERFDSYTAAHKRERYLKSASGRSRILKKLFSEL